MSAVSPASRLVPALFLLYLYFFLWPSTNLGAFLSPLHDRTQFSALCGEVLTQAESIILMEQPKLILVFVPYF